MIAVCLAQPTASVIVRLERATDSLRTFTPRGMTMIHVVKGPVQLPDDATRTAMLRVVKSHNVGLVAMVVNETGFMRSVVTGMRVLTAGRFDYHIASSLEEVADWLPGLHQRKTDVRIGREHLLRALRDAERVGSDDSFAARS